MRKKSMTLSEKMKQPAATLTGLELTDLIDSLKESEAHVDAIRLLAQGDNLQEMPDEEVGRVLDNALVKIISSLNILEKFEKAA
jgi:hypothetical protein